jgi:hypothetical protein
MQPISIHTMNESTKAQNSFIMPPIPIDILEASTTTPHNLITRSAGKHPARQRRHSFTGAELAKRAQQDHAHRRQTLQHEVLAMHIPSYSGKPPRHPQRHRRNSSIGHSGPSGGHSGPSDSYRSHEHSKIASEYSEDETSIAGAPPEEPRPLERQNSVISAKSQRRNSHHDLPVPERSDEGSEHSHASHAPHLHPPFRPRQDSPTSYTSPRRLSRDYQGVDIRDIIRASRLPGWSVMFIGLSSCYETHPKLTIAGLTLFGILLVARKIDFKKFFTKPEKPEKPKDETVHNPKPKDDEAPIENPKSLDFPHKTTHTKVIYNRQQIAKYIFHHHTL